MKSSWFQRYLLPGFVFQSAVIAGGYGTGREIVEFFLSLGPLPGLAAMFVSTAIWSLVAAATFEFARTFRTFEYRGFFKRLLGPAWVAFEITYVLMMLLVLAVIGAAAGEIGRETFGLPYAVGVVGTIGVVGVLVFFGSGAIERVMASWSFVLYAVYAVLLVWALSRFGPQISDSLAGSRLEGSWLLNGVRYAGYNLLAGAVTLFTVRHMRERKEAVTAGLLTGVIGILPALFFYLAVVGFYPEIVDRPVPANYLLESLGSRTFQIAFQIVLFGTLIETGTGMIHAVNERLAEARREVGQAMPRWVRPTVALVTLSLALALTPLGLRGLIADGYGTITWGFVVFYLLPVLTLGVWMIARAGRAGSGLPMGRTGASDRTDPNQRADPNDRTDSNPRADPNDPRGARGGHP